MISVTYMPGLKRFIAGEHKDIPPNMEMLAEYHPDSKSGLSGVQYYAKCDDAHRNLIQTYCKTHILLEKWTPLNSLFRNYFFDELLITRGYEMTPTELRLHNYGSHASKNTSDQITFDLRNAMDSYEVAFNLSADVDFETLPSNILNMLYHREGRASVALKQLPYHYIKDAGDDAAKFQTTATSNDAQRIRHSHVEMLTEIESCCSAFLRTFQSKLTHFACSPNTAPTIAWNTKHRTSLFDKACSTGRGVCPFPGLSGPTMAISNACPTNVIYAVSNVPSPMLRLEGPKTITQNQSETCTVQDFYLYKCVYDVLHIDYPLGCIIESAF